MAVVDCTDLAAGTALVVRPSGLRDRDAVRIVRITKVLKRGYRLDNGRFLSRDGGIGTGWDRYYVERFATDEVINEIEIAESRRIVVLRILEWAGDRRAVEWGGRDSANPRPARRRLPARRKSSEPSGRRRSHNARPRKPQRRREAMVGSHE